MEWLPIAFLVGVWIVLIRFAWRTAKVYVRRGRE